MEDELKIGARNSSKDQSRLQAAHDAIVEAGAMCNPPKSIDIESDEVIYYGSPVKSLGDVEGGLKVGGYLVRFTSADDPDITGDFFDKSTDFDFDFPGKSTAYFNHGMDAKLKRRKLEPMTLTQDEVGIWAEGILRERDEYEKFLVELAKAGKLGLSSGVPGHLVEREPVGKANRITAWPLGKDSSYTHTPAEARNSVMPIKSLLSAAPEAGKIVSAADAVANTVIPILSEKNTMPEFTEEQLKSLVAEASKAAVLEYRKSEPAPKEPQVVITTDEAEQPWKSAGEFFMAVKTAGMYPSQEDRRLRPLKAVVGMSEGVPADGGYLVIPQFAAGIQERMYTSGEILGRVASDPVTGNSMTYNGVDESSRVNGSRWGGVLGYWLGEGGTKTASQPKFRQYTEKLKKVAALCVATDEQLEDTANLESWLNRVAPEELKFQVEEAIYNGDGVAKPLGIMLSPCLIAVTRTTASQIVIGDILAMWARRWAGQKDYVWYISQDAWPWLPQLYIGNFPVFMPPGGITGNPYGTIFGAPVIESEHCQALNTSGDIMLASMSQYQTITKGGVKSASSIHVYFTTDQTAFRFVYRIDGQPMWSSTLTPMHGSNTQSPFVVLGSASA